MKKMVAKMDQTEAVRLQFTVVVDNIVDIFLAPRGPFSYPRPGPASSLWAEQGLAMWLEVSDPAGGTTRILYDFGRGGEVIKHNLAILGLDPSQADYMVLSHGHIDHHGGLISLLSDSGFKGKLVMHPKVFGQRGLKLPSGGLAGPWSLEREKLEDLCEGRLIISSEPVQLAPGICTSGTISRVSELDPRFSAPVIIEGGRTRPDPIDDDMALVINLAGAGLVVVTGCCHAGIFNTLGAAQNLFPRQSLFALIGGLHLNFVDQARLELILAELGKRSLSWLAPIHCTGASASQKIRAAMPEQTVFGTVGLTFAMGPN